MNEDGLNGRSKVDFTSPWPRIHSALCAACYGDPCERGADVQSCARLVKEKLYELEASET